MERNTAIREISRKEYDHLVAGQQAFFDALIKEGRARIVEVEVPPQKKIEHPHPQKPQPPRNHDPGPDLLLKFKGQQITANLINGVIVEGNLDEVAQYVIVIDGLLIYKHAVISIQPTSLQDYRRENLV